MWNSTSAQTPVLDSFLGSIKDLVQNRDGSKLQDFLQLEPPLSPVYNQMVAELQKRYPRDGGKEAELLSKCERAVQGGDSGSSWSAFPLFMRLYFTFLRDVNVDNLLDTYDLLRGLLNQSVIALGDSQMGVVILPTVFYLCKVLAKLAIGLDRKPELIAHLLREGATSGQEETAEKVTLVEKSANVVREAFIKCLTDRSGTPGVHGKPEGRRVGIYLMANLCLKLLFKCGKLRNAEQMFSSINAQSPPLTHFPASQRVTYLYYLGRYLFSNNLFYPAQSALRSAYDQCHKQALNQQRLILSYLIPCNMILGRFPSMQLLERPEAEGLGEKFIPLCQIIAKGDIASFRSYLAVDSSNAEWFAKKGILLQLRNRCEILVWRSLTRKVFILAGFHGDPKMQTQRGPPPFLYLQKLEAAVRWLEARAAQQGGGDGVQPAKGKINQADFQFLSLPTDPDFARKDAANAGVVTDDSNFDDYINPSWYFEYGGEPVEVLAPEDRPNDELTEYEVGNDPSSADPFASLYQNTENNNNNNNEEDANQETSSQLMRDLESILASLLTQDLIRGYLTHRNPRYAIPGARVKGALPTGFPNVWQTIYARERQDEQVPGWVKPPNPKPFGGGGPGARVGAGAAMGGRVVNLSGAKPVGEPTG